MKKVNSYLKLTRKEKLVFPLEEMIDKEEFPPERGIPSARRKTKANETTTKPHNKGATEKSLTHTQTIGKLKI